MFESENAAEVRALVSSEIEELDTLVKGVFLIRELSRRALTGFQAWERGCLPGLLPATLVPTGMTAGIISRPSSSLVETRLFTKIRAAA